MKDIELELPCDLTEEEIQHRAQQLGATIAEYDDVESAKKDAMKEFGERLGELRGRMRRFSLVIRTKSEQRIVKCLVNFNDPTVGIKRIVRLDTGEIYAERPMTDEERHLFEKSRPN
jgi:hypothetical protein